MPNAVFSIVVLALANIADAWPYLGPSRHWRIAVSAVDGSAIEEGDSVCITEVLFYETSTCDGPPLHNSSEKTGGKRNWKAISSNPDGAGGILGESRSVFNGIAHPRGGVFCFHLPIQNADWSSSLSFTAHTWIGLQFTEAVQVRCARMHADFVRTRPDEARSWKDIGPLRLTLTNSDLGNDLEVPVAQWSLQPPSKPFDHGLYIRAWVQLPIGGDPYMFPSECLIRPDVYMGVPPDEACCTWPLPPSLVTPVPAMYEGTHGHRFTDWETDNLYCAPGASVRPGRPCAFDCKAMTSLLSPTGVDAVWSLFECSNDGTQVLLEDFVVELTYCPALWHRPLNSSSNDSDGAALDHHPNTSLAGFVRPPVSTSLPTVAQQTGDNATPSTEEGYGRIIRSVVLLFLLCSVFIAIFSSVIFGKKCRRTSTTLGSKEASVASRGVVVGVSMQAADKTEIDASTPADNKSASQV